MTARVRRTVRTVLGLWTAASALAACGPGHAFLAGGPGAGQPVGQSPGGPVLRPSGLPGAGPGVGPAAGPSGSTSPSGRTTRDRTTAPVARSARARHVSVALTGDVLIHNGVWETAERDAVRRDERLPD